jgi:hypothetical protein
MQMERDKRFSVFRNPNEFPEKKIQKETIL